MTDRPILFSAPMVRALLDGRKTQTRRMAYFADIPVSSMASEQQEHYELLGYRIDTNADGEAVAIAKPRALLKWKAGDRLWVRETWSHTGDGVFEIRQARMAISGHVIYQADKTPGSLHAKYWPSIHMPKEFSRLTLIVTDVRVERLQAISPEDARDEGVNRCSRKVRQINLFGTTKEERDAQYLRACVWEYEELWDRINGSGSWKTNPWVVALTFDVIKQNIDEVPA